MDGYLLETCFLSALFNPGHKKHAAARRTAEGFEDAAVKYVSIITLAELTFGQRAAASFAQRSLDAADEVIRRARSFPLLELTKHTAEEYAEVKANLAKTYLKSALRHDRPRWLEDWVDKATGQKLQVDENDLWLCAQARERNLVLVTVDTRIHRIAKADPLVRLRLV